MRKISKSVAFSVVFYISTFVATLWYISVNWSNLSGKDFSLEPVSLFASVIVGLVGLYIGSLIWYVSLRLLGARKIKDIPELINVYSRAWLGRYIPGTAPWILGKVFFAAKLGISKAKLATSSVLEALVQLVTGLFISLILIYMSPHIDSVPNEIKVIGIIGMLISAMVLVPPVFNALIKVVFKLIKRSHAADDNQVDLRIILKLGGLYAINYLVIGLSMYLAISSVYPLVGYSDISYIMGASLLAGAVGMMAVFVPSGIGVREGALIALLALIMPMEIAIIASIISRLVTVVIDILFLLISTAQKRYSINTSGV